MSGYPDNFSAAAFNAAFGNYADHDAHNDVLERWAAETAAEIARDVAARYVARFGPDAPWKEAEFARYVEEAIYDVGFEA